MIATTSWSDSPRVTFHVETCFFPQGAIAFFLLRRRRTTTRTAATTTTTSTTTKQHQHQQQRSNNNDNEDNNDDDNNNNDDDNHRNNRVRFERPPYPIRFSESIGRRCLLAGRFIHIVSCVFANALGIVSRFIKHAWDRFPLYTFASLCHDVFSTCE